jgi:hypothetical protein
MLRFHEKWEKFSNNGASCGFSRGGVVSLKGIKGRVKFLHYVDVDVDVWIHLLLILPMVASE